MHMEVLLYGQCEFDLSNFCIYLLYLHALIERDRVHAFARPLPSDNTAKRNSCGGGIHKKSKKITQNAVPLFPTIPPCACGAKRVFEFQLLPSLLHVLNVDSSSSLETCTSKKSQEIDETIDITSTGGMNWGAIAIFCCPESCDKGRDEFAIVQQSVDESPLKARGGVCGSTSVSGSGESSAYSGEESMGDL